MPTTHSVTVGVDAAMATQFAARTEGDIEPAHAAYALASADLFFTAGIAQNTLFFADIVGLSGAPPDSEIPTLTLINGYTARLVEQNSLNLREAWLRTEVFKNRLALTAGRLDLTNYFDANAFANDESTQFISDALVNNQMLGLAVNGVGVAAEFDAKNGFRLKFGFQQSSPEPTSLGDSLFTLSEVGYTFTPFSLPEGTYRLWFRTDNGEPDVIRKGVGFSLDQKLTSVLSACSPAMARRRTIWATIASTALGVGFQHGLIFNPEDTWGVGYAQMDLETGRAGEAASRATTTFSSPRSCGCRSISRACSIRPRWRASSATSSRASVSRRRSRSGVTLCLTSFDATPSPASSLQPRSQRWRSASKLRASRSPTRRQSS